VVTTEVTGQATESVIWLQYGVTDTSVTEIDYYFGISARLSRLAVDVACSGNLSQVASSTPKPDLREG
jgi:hypothetical protein